MKSIHRTGRSGLVHSACVVTLAVSLGICLPAARAQLDDPPPLPETANITGALHIFGCTPGPAEFRVFALPLTPPSRTSPDPALRPLEATLSRTADPHSFSYTVPGARFGIPHELRVQTSASACGRFFWESPTRGLAYAGGSPVRVIGYAVKSQIEVLGGQTPGRPARIWVGADRLDALNPAQALRQFRWQTAHPGITSGILQVSTERFPKQSEGSSSCLAPPGLLHSATFPAQSGTWVPTPAVNFSALIQRLGARPGGESRTMEFRLGAPFYVRVIAVSGRTARSDSMEDGPAPWVVLANIPGQGGFSRPGMAGNGPGSSPDVKITFGTKFAPSVPYASPVHAETAYRVIKEHPLVPADVKWSSNPSGGFPVPPKDPWGAQFINFSGGTIHPGDTLHPGARLITWPGSGGFDIGDIISAGAKIVTGFIDAIGFAVDAVSQAYEDAKAAVVKVAASAISITGIKCGPGTACEGLVQTALTTGLTAMGLPPSLPNWNEVVDKGFEYMAYQVASQAGVGNVPGAAELTEAVARKIAGEAIKLIQEQRGGGGGMPDWLTLDLGQDPAILTLSVDRLSSSAFQTNMIRILQSPIFEGADVQLPAFWPKGTVSPYLPVTIPVALRPNDAGFVPPKYPDGTLYGDDYFRAKVARDAWRLKVQNNTCNPFIFSGFSTSGSLILAEKGLLGAFAVNPSYVSFWPAGTCSAN